MLPEGDLFFEVVDVPEGQNYGVLRVLETFVTRSGRENRLIRVPRGYVFATDKGQLVKIMRCCIPRRSRS